MATRHEKSKGTALVTGASRGIGKAIAAALAADGWYVTGTCRDPRRLSAEDRVPGVRYLPLDFSRKASVEGLIRKARPVDLLVNNAGIGSIGPVEEAPLARVRALFEVNLFGALRVTQGLLPGMRDRKRGTVIFIGSMAAEFPRAFTAFYAGSKAAMRAMADALRLEVRACGIRVAVVAPFNIATTFPQETQTGRGWPYGAAVGGVKRERDRMMLAGPGAGEVAEAVMDLLGRNNPPSFTPVGHRARMQAFFIRHLPRRTVEAVSAKRFKL